MIVSIRNSIWILLVMLTACARQPYRNKSEHALESPKAEIVLYVAPGGNGDGSGDRPFGSIQKALEQAVSLKNSQGKNVEVIVKDGLYRETVSVTQRAENDAAAIMLRAEHKGNVIISGSIRLENWQSGRDGKWDKSLDQSNIIWAKLPPEVIKKLTHDPESGETYTDGRVPNPWPRNVDDNGLFYNGMMRVDDQYYFPVKGSEQLVPGSFTIKYEEGLIFVKLLSRVQRYDQIEMAVEPAVFLIANQRNFRMEGIHVQHAGWALRDAVIFRDMKNLRVTDCTFNNNRYTGLETHRIENAVFMNCEASLNGGKGAAGSWEGYMRNVIFDGFKANDNNWIGGKFNFTGWDPCGVKWSGTRDLVIRNSEFNNNYAAGLWLDCENRRVTVENTEARNNIGAGFYIEANKGPVTITGSTIVNNLRGMHISCTEDVTVLSTRIVDNDYQVVVFDHWLEGRGPGLRPFDFVSTDDGSKWVSHTINTTFRNCTIKNRKGSTNPLYAPVFGDHKGYAQFLESLSAEGNSYQSEFPDQAFVVNESTTAFKLWQEKTGQDRSSIFTKIED